MTSAEIQNVMNDQTRYRQATHVARITRDEQTHVANLRTSAVIALNGVGALIWDELEDWVTLENLERQMFDLFPDVDAAEIVSTVTSFVTDLASGGFAETEVEN